ncbi:MAG: hypothetical protein ACK4J0_03805, partial [Candidatus Anstonellaceae archaeon]
MLLKNQENQQQEQEKQKQEINKLLSRLAKTKQMLDSLTRESNQINTNVIALNILLSNLVGETSSTDLNKLDSMLTSFLGYYLYTPSTGNMFLKANFSFNFIKDNQKVLSDILIKLASSNLDAEETRLVFNYILNYASDLYKQDSRSASFFLNELKSEVFAKLDLFTLAKFLTAGPTGDGRLNVSPTINFPSYLSMSRPGIFAGTPFSFSYANPIYHPLYSLPLFNNYPSLLYPFLDGYQPSIFDRLEKIFDSFYVSSFSIHPYIPTNFFFPKFYYESSNLTNKIAEIYIKYKKPTSSEFKEAKGGGTLSPGYGNIDAALKNPDTNTVVQAGANFLKENEAIGLLAKNLKVIGIDIINALLNYYNTSLSSNIFLGGSPFGYSYDQPISSYVIDPSKQPFSIGAYTFTPVERPPVDPAILHAEGVNFLPYFSQTTNKDGSKQLDTGFFVKFNGQWFHVEVDESKLPEGELKNSFAEFKSTL